MDAIEFLIKNTYIMFGNLCFLQICGIPMGMIPAPQIAKIGLSIDEYEFVRSNLQKNNISKLIYPEYLKLNKI